MKKSFFAVVLLVSVVCSSAGSYFFANHAAQKGVMEVKISEVLGRKELSLNKVNGHHQTIYSYKSGDVRGQEYKVDASDTDGKERKLAVFFPSKSGKVEVVDLESGQKV